MRLKILIATLILVVSQLDEVRTQLTLSTDTRTFNDPSQSSQCEPLDTDILELCKGIAYNETRFPNFMKQKSQQEAAADTRLYLPLVKINCSPVLKLFLCSLYAPPCVKDYSSTLLPCREMCQKAKSGCESTMQRLVGFNWPEYIDCWRFPSFHGSDACVTDETYASQQQKVNNYAQVVTPVGGKATADDFLSSLNKEQHEMLFKTLGNLSEFI